MASLANFDREQEDLDARLANTVRECKEFQSLRVQQLESSLKEATEQLSSLRQRFNQLREDFRYNLVVLEKRDGELERYDAIAAKAQTVESARQEELSQLRIEVAKLVQQRDREAQGREQEQRLSQRKATQHRLQLKKLQSSMVGDMQKQSAEQEGMRRDLQHRIQEAEGELALQRQEMTADFDNVLRQREHEFNLQMDEMRAVVLSHEIKVNLLAKEAEFQLQAQLEAAEALKASEELYAQARAQLRHKDLEITEIASLKDNRIKELEKELKRIEAKLEKEVEDHIKKHQDLERALRERDGRLEAQQRAHSRRLQTAENRVAELQSAVDGVAAESSSHLRDHQGALAERDQTIERLHRELETTSSGWDKYIKQVSKETVVKDTGLLAVEEREAKLKSELERSRQETERYRQQLSAGLQREAALEQRRVQVELAWQSRCEEATAQHYLASESLIQGLTQARDQAQAEVKERVRELEEAAVLLQAITGERDQALQGVIAGPGHLVSEELSRLQQQNGSLRAVVAQMRKDIEGLSKLRPSDTAPLPQLPSDTGANAQRGAGALSNPAGQQTAHPAGRSDTSRPEDAGTTEYTQVLEQEVCALKTRCRHLAEQLEGATNKTVPASAKDVPVTGMVGLVPVAPENAYLQNHIRSLNETIGGLRMEKVANTAAHKKQEVRVAHLESALASLTQQCYAKQVEGEELRLQLTNQKCQWASEGTGLRQRLATVEMELEEVRREKEEYQKSHILNHLETVALGNQVSALKLDIASRREPIVCEQSEMERQLREENLNLRQQILALGPGGVAGDAQHGKTGAPQSASHLQAKLKQAARSIGRLTRDKQQLIEMGNRLRAQLTAAGLEVDQCTVRAAESTAAEKEKDSGGPRPVGQQDHLSVLERLQYQLTTQELQYAQRGLRQGAPVVMVRALLSESDSGGQNGAANPWGQGHKDTARREHSRSKENSPSPLSQSQGYLHSDRGSQPPSSPSGPLLSSVATEGSLREVWQMIDRGLSPSLLTEAEGELGRQDSGPSRPGVQLRLEGIKAPIQNQSVTQAPQRGRPSRMASHTAKTSKTSKIKNYNIKD